jgi:hypothetical protein
MKFQLQFLMAHSDTKVKINDDIETPCYRKFQIANTSHSCLPKDTLKAEALPGFNPKYQTKRKTTFCLNNIMWFIYFTNYIIISQPSVLQITWQVANNVSTQPKNFFLNPLCSNTQTFWLHACIYLWGSFCTIHVNEFIWPIQLNGYENSTLMLYNTSRTSPGHSLHLKSYECYTVPRTRRMKILLSIKTHNDDLINPVSWHFYFCHYQVTPTSRT